MIGNLFSESWYRVCDLRVCLLYSVKIHKQDFRGKTWFVISDPFNNHFFRIRLETYDFLMRLSPKQTVEEIWEDCLIRNPQNAPTQDEVIRLLSQLHMANLLYFENTADTRIMFERLTEMTRKEKVRTIASILFLKVPLWDPELWLKRYNTLIHAIFSRFGAFLWFLVIGLGLKTALDHKEQLFLNTQGILAPDNLIYLYLCLAVLKFFHEMGHAMLTKRFGGEVHTMGVMFLVLTPLPYMDASASWAFRNKWHRILVSAAGMIVELFFAAIACLVWANTGDGLIHSLAFNVMFIGSVSSLLFNGNPLARLDSYYILSDLLEIPNLSNRSKEQWKYILDHYLFGLPHSHSLAESRSESFWLLFYGLLSSAYRILLSVGIAMFVMDKWFVLGLIFATMTLVFWFIKPVLELIHSVFFDEKYTRVRARSIGLTLLFLGIFAGGIGILPVRNSIRAPGIVDILNYTKIITASDGYLSTVHKKNGDLVNKGDLLFELENPELNLDLQIVKAQIQESEALKSRAMDRSIADLEPIQERLLFLHSKVNSLLEKQAKLRVYAEVSGILSAPNLHKFLGSHVSQGFEIGSIVPDATAEFIAVVSQEQAYDLFQYQNLLGEVRLFGNSDRTLIAKQVQVIPYEKNELPSAALGWLGGGSIAVEQKDGITTLDSFFEVRVQLDENYRDLHHQRTGVLRLILPPATILEQAYKSLRQLLQKRYQI